MTQSIGNRPIGTGNNIGPILPSAENGESNAQIHGRQSQESPVQQPVPSARSLSQKLDSMLFMVAQTTTRSVYSPNLQKVVSATKLSSNTRAELTDAADQAAKAFKELGKFSGREIAAALVVGKDNKLDWGTTPVAQALKKAIDTQAQLSEKLHDVVSSPKVVGDALETLTEMALQADRRQSEIMTLAFELADAAEQKGEDPDVVARLDAKVEQLLPRQALQMHGTNAAIERIKAELQPLADRLEAFAARPNASLSSEEFAALQREITMARNALKRVEEEGIATPDGGRWLPDKSFFAFAKQVADFTEKILADTRKKIGMLSLSYFVEQTFKLSNDWPIVYKENLDGLSTAAPTLAKAAKARLQMLELARKCVKDPSEKNEKALRKAVDNYKKLSEDKIIKEIDRLRTITGIEMTKDDWDALLASFRKPRGMVPLVTHLLDGIKRVNENMSPEKFLSTDSARELLKGHIVFSTIVEARIHGMSDADIDPKLDDSNMVSSEKLGQGKANTVYLVTYKDGSEYVFKPEAAGRMGMETLALSIDYKPEQQVAALNLATQRTAKALGLEDVIPKTTVGSYDGQYGLFMKKAPGNTVSAFAKSKIAPYGGLTAEGIKRLPDKEHGVVIGEIIRQTNRLEWLDLITAQGDRHNKNYMIDVRPDGKVTVTGIDNDECFPVYQTGLRKFHLQWPYCQLFDSAYEDIIKAYPEKYHNEIHNRLKSDPGVIRNTDGSLELDATKFKAKELYYALKKAVGLQNAVLPNFIDKDTYEHLQALKSGPVREAYFADLRSRLPEDAVVSTMTRLDQAIEHAESLKDKNMVISKGDFAKRDVQKHLLQSELTGRGPIEPTKNGKFSLTSGDIVKKVNHQTHSLFVRDLQTFVCKKGWLN